jgi:hypothetical protein
MILLDDSRECFGFHDNMPIHSGRGGLGRSACRSSRPDRSVRNFRAAEGLDVDLYAREDGGEDRLPRTCCVRLRRRKRKSGAARGHGWDREGSSQRVARDLEPPATQRPRAFTRPDGDV